ncbi:MAG: phosphoribosylaminoimidazolesuccinocarboxamide synthase [Firmicutes bacterium]|nr:phosphoribosylaminoimidazolesuccinocarboxamide synthase [Bacillota bacterium]MCL2255548.1 phosphoribosylaminoimidazolesuccinocarboxamide synthase [Bacillota bacterium]
MKGFLYEGKSKTIYAGDSFDTLVIKYKNTLTAFNGEKSEEKEGKGSLNARTSHLIYNYLSSHGINTHLVKQIDEVSFICRKAEIIPVEIIVRNVAAGSFSKKYGVEEGHSLKSVSLEYSLKSDELGDPMINTSQILALGISTEKELKFLEKEALKINELLKALFLKIGIKLVDFKLEFGRVNDEIILCDEISADSCRLWDVETGKKLDKDIFRRDLGDVLDGYRELLSRLENTIGKEEKL